MIKHNLCFVALPLVALLACTPDKGTETDSSSTTEGTTDGSTGGATEDPTEGTSTVSPSEATEPEITASSTEGEDTTGDTEGTTGDVGEFGPPCVDTPTVLALGDDTPFGVTVEALLADKLGARDTTLTFAEEPLTLSDAWKGKELPLVVELRHEGGEIRWIDSEVNPDYDPNGNEGFPGECEDRLEIDVELDFVTEGLEFDEHREATLWASSADWATVRAELLPPGIMGSFDADALYSDPEWVVTGVEIGGIWQGASAGGSLLNEVVVGGDDGFAGFGGVARWGDEIDG